MKPGGDQSGDLPFPLGRMYVARSRRHNAPRLGGSSLVHLPDVLSAVDGVVFRLDLDDPYHREMLRCYRAVLGETSPIHVVVVPGQEHRHAGLLSGFSVSLDGIGAGLSGLSSQVAMSAAARLALSGSAPPAHALQDSNWDR